MEAIINNVDDKKLKHRAAALKWARANAEHNRVYAINRYYAKRDEINAKKRAKRAAKKTTNLIVV